MHRLELHRLQGALGLAIQNGHRSKVQSLLSAGALPDGLAGHVPPLVVATAVGDIAIMDALLRAGADVVATTAAGETALHFAAGELHLNAAACLLVNNAQVNAVDDLGRTPLHWATELARFRPVAANQLAHLLLEVGADGNARDLVKQVSVFDLRPDWHGMATRIRFEHAIVEVPPTRDPKLAQL